MFGFDLRKMPLQSCFLQELCRFVLIMLVCNDTNTAANFTDMYCLNPPKYIVR